MRSIFYMGLSVAVRLIFGLLAFAVMARPLGPTAFGLVMTALAISGVAGLLLNFGLSTYALREIGSTPANARHIIQEVLSARLILTACLGAAFLACFAWLPDWLRPLLVCMLVAQVADAFTDLLNVALRATGRYKLEAGIATFASITQCAIIAVGVSMYESAIAAALSYTLARVLVAVVTCVAQSEQALELGESLNLRAGLTRLRHTYTYAIDQSLQGLFGQVDSLVLNHFLGPAAVGLYQAGMRFLIGGLQAATVLSNVYIPSLALAGSGSPQFHDATRRSQLCYLVIGLAGGLLFSLVPSELVTIVFGPSYHRVGELFPLFGLLFAIRLQASAWGMLLTVLGAQGVRSALILAHWITALLLATWLVPTHGPAGWILCLVGANVLLTVGYLLALLGIHQESAKRSSLCLPHAAGVLSCVTFFALLQYGI